MEDELVLYQSSAAMLSHDPEVFVNEGVRQSVRLLQFFKESRKCLFGHRRDLEYNSDMKQLIPYVALVRMGKVLMYRRREGDARLVDKCSIGIGGHVRSKDGGDSFFETVVNGAVRELKEELEMDSAMANSPLEFLGFLYDGSNDVGRVHFGLVFVLRLLSGPATMYIRSRTSELSVIGWFTPRVLLEMPSLEGWSAYLVKFLAQHQGFANDGI